MQIQWFPGHMAKAKKEVQEKLKLVDIVFELVDARIPESSRNPLLKNIIQQKPHLMLLNKSDLADANATKAWIDHYQKNGESAMAISAQSGQNIQKITQTASIILKEQIDRRKAKGMKPRAIRAMIIGIPNVGKSTLINRLIKKNIAKTGNKPGVTKGQQWLKIDKDLELLDTPGILWPKFEDQEIGKKLAVTGAIKDALLSMDDLAMAAITYLQTQKPAVLQEKFHLSEKELMLDSPNLLMLLTEKMGFKEDYTRASERLIFDMRNGRLGRYTLDIAPISATSDMKEVNQSNDK